MLDFTNCKRLYDRVYNGANGKKIAIEYEGEPYMLKFPPSGENKPTELSYTNSCISEHIASTVFNMVGIPAQKTILGTFEIGGKSKIVCACTHTEMICCQIYRIGAISQRRFQFLHVSGGTKQFRHVCCHRFSPFLVAVAPMAATAISLLYTKTTCDASHVLSILRHYGQFSIFCEICTSGACVNGDTAAAK